MTKAYADAPLVGALNTDEQPAGYPLEGLRGDATDTWGPLHCGTCGCNTPREKSAVMDDCDCRCHEAWRIFHRGAA